MADAIAIKDGLFAGGDDAHLLGGRCDACGQLHFPAQTTCPYCGADECAVQGLSRDGRLVLFTAVVNRPPGYRGPMPFGFGIVELAGGVRVIGRLSEADLAALRPGLPMRTVVEPLFTDDAGREVLSYALAPARAGSAIADPTPFAPVGSAMADPTRVAPVGSAIADPGVAPNGRSGTGRATRAERANVAIAGVGIHPFGRFEGKTVTEMGAEAVRAALREAGVGRGGFQAAFCGTVYSGVAAGHKVLTALGLTGIPIVNVEAGCASGGAALILGVEAIRSGRYDCVLVFGMEKMPRGIIRSSFFEPWREEAGLAVNPAYFALRAQRLVLEHGVTREHLAQVSVKNHRHGVHNPYAMYRKEFSLDAVLHSAMVCDPLTLYMLCAPNEGAAAVVLRPARDGAAGEVRIAAAALRSHLPGSVLGEHTPMSGLAVDPPGPTELAAREAYEAAGLGPEDLDVVELQDTDSGRELLSYEELGLCPPRRCGEWIEQGFTALGGRLPVNPSGGLLSKGEPLGASGLGQLIELYWQLRGEAGARQVEGAKVALAHTVGRGANACVVILER
jgi:acetyl-CoA acetyltransferase/uncharacterized OB-fold protein